MQATGKLKEDKAQELPENMRKYYNYREQMGRLKKAINMEFYLEAVFIEYAVMEDRLKSVLEKEGIYDPREHNGLDAKVEGTRKLIGDTACALYQYITPNLLDDIKQWKTTRNKLIHGLMNQAMTTEDLKEFALQGQDLAKTLSNKVTLYKRYLERRETHA